MVAAGAWRENGLVALPVALRASRGRASRGDARGAHPARGEGARGEARRPRLALPSASSSASSSARPRGSRRSGTCVSGDTAAATPHPGIKPSWSSAPSAVSAPGRPRSATRRCARASPPRAGRRRDGATGGGRGRSRPAAGRAKEILRRRRRRGAGCRLRAETPAGYPERGPGRDVRESRARGRRRVLRGRGRGGGAREGVERRAGAEARRRKEKGRRWKKTRRGGGEFDACGTLRSFSRASWCFATAGSLLNILPRSRLLRLSPLLSGETPIQFDLVRPRTHPGPDRLVA